MLDVCSACWGKLEPWNGPACSRCGLPFASERALDATEPLCADCRQGEFQFDAARSFGVYRDPLRRAILHLKFRPRERWGRRLGGLLAQCGDRHPPGLALQGVAPLADEVGDRPRLHGRGLPPVDDRPGRVALGRRRPELQRNSSACQSSLQRNPAAPRQSIPRRLPS